MEYLGWILLLVVLLISNIIASKQDKSIKELERLNDTKTKSIDKYREGNDTLQRELDSIVGYIKSTPSDCKIGEWCGGCKLRRVINIPKQRYGYSTEVYICGKDGICKNFVSANEEE